MEGAGGEKEEEAGGREGGEEEMEGEGRRHVSLSLALTQRI